MKRLLFLFAMLVMSIQMSFGVTTTLNAQSTNLSADKKTATWSDEYMTYTLTGGTLTWDSTNKCYTLAGSTTYTLTWKLKGDNNVVQVYEIVGESQTYRTNKPIWGYVSAKITYKAGSKSVSAENYTDFGDNTINGLSLGDKENMTIITDGKGTFQSNTYRLKSITIKYEIAKPFQFSATAVADGVKGNATVSFDNSNWSSTATTSVKASSVAATDASTTAYFKAEPANSNYIFKGWSETVDGEIVSTKNPYDASITSTSHDPGSPTNTTLYAHFSQLWDYYSRLTVNAEGSGKVLVSKDLVATPSVTSISSSANKSVLKSESKGGHATTYYIYIKPESGYKLAGFVGISPMKVSETCYQYSVLAESNDENSPTTKSATAVFVTESTELADVNTLPLDVTCHYITNPQYEAEPWNTGWYLDKFEYPGNDAMGVNNKYAQIWSPDFVSGSISQTINNLPAGTYVLGATAIAGTDGTVSIKVSPSNGIEQETIVPFMAGDKKQYPTLEFVLDETDNVTISFNRDACCWWTAVDDWTLTYYGVVEEDKDLEIDTESKTYVWIYKYGSASDVLNVELTNEVPVVDVTGAKAETINVTATNPNGLLFKRANQTVNGISNNIVVDGVCANLVLVDGSSFHNHKNFTAVNATYTMSDIGDFSNGTYGTLTLPFTPTTLPDGCETYTLDRGVTPGDYLNGTETSIAANTPMLVTEKGTYSATNADVPAINAASRYENGELVGHYMPEAVPEGAYVMQRHSGRVAFYLVATTRPMASTFRAYIKSQSSSVRALYVLFPEDQETGIEEMTDKRETTAPLIYDLSGRQVKNAQHGVYIINGKKVLK